MVTLMGRVDQLEGMVGEQVEGALDLVSTCMNLQERLAILQSNYDALVLDLEA